MNKSGIQRRYFEWLCKVVKASKEYSMLWDKLRRTDFVWIVGMDENRANDGVTLRYNFAVESGFLDVDSQKLVEEYLSGPCSLLEMMVALSIRIERDIMSDVDHEDRTSFWFYNMLENLGVYPSYDNKHYDENQVDEILNRFMSRKYEQNGVGNLFLGGPKSGPFFLEKEIWAQANSYLLEFFI